jgi:hypothetical protein
VENYCLRFTREPVHSIVIGYIVDNYVYILPGDWFMFVILSTITVQPLFF